MLKSILKYIKENNKNLNIWNILPLLIIVVAVIILLIFLSYHNYMKNKINKVVVFDFDETLGCFVQLGVFCDAIEKLNNKKLSKREFFKILNLYPEYFRPHLIPILIFLKQKKIKKELYKVCLYTNNQGPKEWAAKICEYLDKKMNFKLFDKHIGAYKTNGVITEPTRTTHEKTVDDFFNSTNFPFNTKICFIDDVYHPEMDKSNVYYINVEPYKISIPINVLASRYIENIDDDLDLKSFDNYLHNFFNKYDINEFKYNNNINHNDNGKNILNKLKIFLETKSKSKKNKSKKNKSKKILG
tara:strand:- start:7775 stop:8674 length:900 start_codon:yes stop_codon:yes gene_type:complete